MSTDTIDPAKYPLTLQAKPFPLGKRSAYEGELFAIYEANGLTIREVSANEQPYEYDEMFLAMEHFGRLLEFAAACNAEIAARSAAENSARAER
jgi:hypothetical protein